MSELPTSDHVEAELEHQRLTSLINSMVDGVIAVDEHAKVALYNGAALNILDSNQSISGKTLDRVCHLYDENNQPLNITRLIRETTVATINRDYRLQYADGSYISLYLSIAPVHLGYGREGSKGHVIMLRDITREKSLEEERDEFISVVSHELRTPIAIAEGNISNAQFVFDKQGDRQQITQALEEAHSQTLFLASMINDLSTLSRAERGTLAVDVEPINVHELVEQLAETYRADAAAKNLVIHTDVRSRLELLNSARLYVREILQNFITNAIKYTEAGSVTIGAKPAPKGVYIWIEDTGIGISKSDQEKIYDKFFRSEDYRTRQNNGTGLGLYVTMKLARLVHADIATKSELNKGSCFTIFLPNLQ
ncbi:MAG TPA: ATP-binding protein [Candidatus Limnocylindrales bacterium]|nr:ATP-binding protein [Candidatus Limnocylindrales bacterium]